jgi:uncharacterized protein (TIGR00299 family) protein
MKTLRFDSVGGASGDMVLGALVAVGVPVDAMQRAVDAVIPGSVTIGAERGESRGLAGMRVTVHAGHGHHHEHRGLETISAMIGKSGLPDRTRNMALAVFRRLAEAEGKVHGIPPDQVHFHEVGALDAIADVVASCAALEHLGADAVAVGPLPVGRGTTSAAHGALPLPVPAVAELLTGFPVMQTDEPYELVTPTGAAILTTWASEMPAAAKAGPATIVGAGYGLGHRTLAGRANALRAMVLDEGAVAGDTPNRCMKLECNLDDMTPEVAGALFQKLMECGALDVFTTAVQMKKQRPGVLLTVLCRVEDREKMLDVVFREGTSFGVRESVVDRTVLDRRIETVQTAFGPIRVKCGTWKGEVVTRSPEYEDCAAAAKKHGVAVRNVIEAAIKA